MNASECSTQNDEGFFRSGLQHVDIRHPITDDRIHAFMCIRERALQLLLFSPMDLAMLCSVSICSTTDSEPFALMFTKNKYLNLLVVGNSRAHVHHSNEISRQRIYANYAATFITGRAEMKRKSFVAQLFCSLEMLLCSFIFVRAIRTWNIRRYPCSLSGTPHRIRGL